MKQRMCGVLLLLGLTLTGGLKAQKRQVEGRVINAHNQKGLTYANVQVKNTPLVTNTNEAGCFEFDHLDQLKCTLLVSVPGYYPLEVHFEKGQLPDSVVLALEPGCSIVSERFVLAGAWSLKQSMLGMPLINMPDSDLVDLRGLKKQHEPKRAGIFIEKDAMANQSMVYHPVVEGSEVSGQLGQVLNH